MDRRLSLCQWLLGQWESKQGGKVDSGKIQFPGGHWKKSRPETKTRCGPEREKSACYKQTCFTGSSLEFFELCLVKVASEFLDFYDTAREIRNISCRPC